MSLKIGDKIKIKNGVESQIIGEFGTGGQGTVYKVKYQGKDYALKWYHNNVFRDKWQDFYRNLENNISKGAPTKNFLWPLGITEYQLGSFGYLMNIRPGGYSELTEFFVGTKKKPQVHFASFTAISNAAINIIQAFRVLHNNGYTYQDINNGNFFINPLNGDVLICDNDNVSPFGKNLGIMGKQRWMAPEVVTGGDPDKLSDRFSLSVVLFRLLFINHPLEGKYSTPPCMTKDLERKYYGTDPIFIMDPNDTRNRPVPGTAQNLKLFWPVYPKYIKEMFVKAFSQEVMLDRSKRIIEKEWLDLFFRLRAETGSCPFCKKEMFWDTTSDNVTCFECNKPVSTKSRLRLSKFSLPIYDGLKVHKWLIDSSSEDIETVIAEVIHNPKEPQLLGLSNISSYTWKVNLPDDTQRPLVPGKILPVKNQLGIDFLGNNYISTVEL